MNITFARQLFEGSHIYARKRLRSLIAQAKQLGLQNEEIQSIVTQSDAYYLISVTKDMIGIPEGPFKERFRQAIIDSCAFNTSKKCQSVFDAIKLKLRAVLSNTNINDFLLEICVTMPPGQTKAVLLLRVLDSTKSDNHFVNESIIKQLKDLYPLCSYEIKKEIYEQLTKFKYDDPFYDCGWVCQAFLEDSADLPQLNLIELKDLLIRFRHEVFGSGVLLLKILKKSTDLMINNDSSNIIGIRHLETIYERFEFICQDRAQFDQASEIFCHNFIHSASHYLLEQSGYQIQFICKTLVYAFNRSFNNKNSEMYHATHLMLIALQQQLQFDQTMPGVIKYEPIQDSQDYKRNILTIYSPFIEGRESISKTRFKDNIEGREFISKTRFKDNLELIQALFKTNRLEDYNEERCQKTITLAKTIYGNAENEIRVRIRYQVIKFFVRLCQQLEAEDIHPDALGKQLIQDFDLSTSESTEHCIHLLNKMAGNEYFLNWTFKLHEKVKAVLLISQLLDNTSNSISILINHILTNISLPRESIYVYLKGFILPILSYETSPRVVKALINQDRIDYYGMSFVLHLTDLDGSLKLYVVSKLNSIPFQNLIPLLQPLMRHCKKDPQFKQQVENILYTLFTADFHTRNTLTILPSKSLLAFVGFIKGDFTINDLFSEFFTTKTDAERFHLLKTCSLAIFHEELHKWFDYRFNQITLSEIHAYYLFYKNTYKMLCERFIVEDVTHRRWNDFETYIQSMPRKSIDLDPQSLRPTKLA